MILQSISTFAVDIVLVMSHDRLHASLVTDVGQGVTVVKLPRFPKNSLVLATTSFGTSNNYAHVISRVHIFTFMFSIMHRLLF